MTKLQVMPKIGEQKTLFENSHQRLYCVTLDFESASKEIFVTDYGHRVGVIVSGSRGILLTKQYRYLINRISLEIPGGKAEPGEDHYMAAQRECLEETGIFCSDMKPLLTFQPGLDTLHNPSHLFYTNTFEEKNQAGVRLANTETIGNSWVPISECLNMISEGVIVDSLSIIGILMYSRVSNHSG